MRVRRSPELEEFARALDAAIREGDVERIRSAASTDPCFLAVGTDRDEVWRTPAEAIPSLEESVEQLTTGELGQEMGEVTAYEEGDFGWIIGLGGAFTLSDGTAIPVRVITIAHREDGDWKVVFNMAAIPVPNSALDPSSPLATHLASRR